MKKLRVTASTNVYAITGTPAEFAAALKNKINELGGDVDINSATNIEAAEAYEDTQGIMGEPGDVWTYAELREYWDSEQLNDPVMSQYDSFEDWVDDTISYMTPVESATETADAVAAESKPRA